MQAQKQNIKQTKLNLLVNKYQSYVSTGKIDIMVKIKKLNICRCLSNKAFSLAYGSDRRPWLAKMGIRVNNQSIHNL